MRISKPQALERDPGWISNGNPLDTPLIKKTFRKVKHKPRKAIPKEIIDELTFNCQSLRDRLILELQSPCRARIGEVLGIRVKDIDGRKVTVFLSHARILV